MWLEGYQALLRWRAENEITGLYAVPYDTETEVGVTKAFPLGRWVHQQRKALRAGELEERRKTLLDLPEAGMVWEPGEEAWEKKLAVFRAYRRATGHLAPRQDAVWDDPVGGGPVPIGQHIANLRRKGGLGKDPERVRVRAEQLAAIDLDWNCPWPLDWQRHYRVLADLAAYKAGGILPGIAPGVLFDGDDLGRWLQRQKQPSTWRLLSSEQQERLTQLGIKPTETPPAIPAPQRAAKGPSKAQAAFQRGLAALTQWIEREGQRPVPRGHRRNHHRRPEGAGSNPARGVGLQRQEPTRQAHRRAVGGAAGAGRGVGTVTAADVQPSKPPRPERPPRRGPRRGSGRLR